MIPVFHFPVKLTGLFSLRYSKKLRDIFLTEVFRKMPIYEYECNGCGKRHEIMQKITDFPLTECPDCGAELKRMISNTSFVLKGTGWYMTDYASKKRSPSAEVAQKKAPGEGAKKGDTKAEAKPETKAAAASK
jgi:putative FmdB family regulatory protein